MSVHLHVHLEAERMPDANAWQAAVRAAGYDSILHELSPREHTGFLPCRLNGAQCGFEFSLQEDIPEDDELLSVIGNRKFVADFTWRTNDLDGQAAEIAAAALAQLTDGILVDPQSGCWTPAAEVFEQLEQDRADVRARRQAEAEKKWADETSRRCPHCGAPCPEYRKHCFVCGLELGRADR